MARTSKTARSPSGTGSGRQEHDEKRREPRFALSDSAPVTVILKRRRYPARVRDISQGGLRVEIEGDMPRGARVVHLDHPVAGRLRGACAWQGESQLGVAFDAAESELERALQCICLMLNVDQSASAAA